MSPPEIPALRDRRFLRVLCALTVVLANFGVLFAAPAAAFPGANLFEPALLSSPFNESSDSEVAYSPTGDGIAAWFEVNDTTTTLWTARHSFVSGWTASSFLTESPTSLSDLALALRPTGAATLAWIQDGTPPSIWYAELPATGPAGPAQLLRNASAFFVAPLLLAVGGAGVSFMFWGESDGNTTGWAAAIHPTTGVTGPQRIDGGSGAVIDKALVVDPTTGGATALWCDRSGVNANITTAAFAPGVGWASPVVGVPGIAGVCGRIAAGVDTFGNIALLFAHPGPPATVMAYRKAPGDPWSAADPIGPLWTAASVEALSLEAQLDGTLVGAWLVQDRSTYQFTLFAAAWTATAGWETTRLADNLTSPVGFDIAPAEGRGGLVLYTPTSNGTDFLGAAQFTREPGCTGWQTIGAPGMRGLQWDSLEAAVDSNGVGQVLFRSHNGVANVLFAALVAMAIPPAPEILSPAYGASYPYPVASVSGRSWPGAVIVVHGATMTAGPTGQFTATIPLEAGPNLIEFEFRHEGDTWQPCTATATLVVYYVDELSATRALLDGTMANLAQTTADLAQAQSDLDTTRAELDAIRETQNATQLALNDTQDDLVRAQVEVADLSLALNQTRVELNGTNEKWLRSNLHAAYLEAQLNLTSSELNATKVIMQHQQSDLDFAKQQAESAASGATMTMVLALVGAALGAVGVASSFLRGRGGGGGGGSGGDSKRHSASQQAQAASPSGKGGPDKQEPPGPANHGG